MQDRLLRLSRPLAAIALFALPLWLVAGCTEPLVDGFHRTDVVEPTADAAKEVSDTSPADACSQCGPGTTCVDQVCVAPTPCSSDKHCPPDEICDKVAGHCVQCLEHTDCDAGWACVQTRCTPAPATCSSNTDCVSVGWVCGSAGTCVGCEADAHCPAASWCAQGLCAADVCAAGQLKCVDPLTRAVCDGNGGGWSTTPCADEQSCDGGKCSAESCKPGAGKCGAGKAWTCKSDGTGWHSVACGGKQVCAVVVGAASFKNLICVAGELGCVGKLGMKCSDDGITQQLVVDCNKAGPDGEPQVCAAGKCISGSCVPATSVCSDDKTVATCGADGKTTTTTKCGDSTPLCVAGQCLACEPDGFYCAQAPPDGPSKVVMKCNKKGTDGEISLVCKEDQICFAGLCAKPALCIPGSLYCGPKTGEGTSTLVMKCNSAGNDGDIHEICKGAKTCVEGECLGKKVCTLGQTVCHGLGQVATCGNKGTQWAFAACAAGSSCVGGICQPGIICAAKTVYCAGPVLKLCGADGKSSETGMDCATEQKVCLGGLCVKPACTAKPGVVACGDGCCAADENAKTCAQDCPCAGGKKLLTAKHWCDDSGSKPGWRDQPGLCKKGHRDGWFAGLPCPFDAAVGQQAGWKGPCFGCLEGKIIDSGAGERVAAWRDDAKVYYCCKGKDLMRVDKK